MPADMAEPLPPMNQQPLPGFGIGGHEEDLPSGARCPVNQFRVPDALDGR